MFVPTVCVRFRYDISPLKCNSVDSLNKRVFDSILSRVHHNIAQNCIHLSTNGPQNEVNGNDFGCMGE